MRHRSAILALAAMLACGFIGFAIGRGKPQAPPAPERPADADWDRVVREVRLPAMPLDELVQALQDLTHANIVVDWHSLKNSGVNVRLNIGPLELRDLLLSKMLQTVLDIVNDDNSNRFTKQYHVRAVPTVNGAILVTASPFEASEVFVRVYDVRDLVSGPAIQPFDAAARDRLDGMIDLLTKTIPFNSAWEGGGQVSWIRELDGRLIVRQSLDGHRQVEQMLQEFRAPGSTPLAGFRRQGGPAPEEE